MVGASVRAVLCVLVGLLVGVVVGPLFVPDPTGLLVPPLVLLVAGVVAGLLYRSEWLRESAG